MEQREWRGRPGHGRHSRGPRQGPRRPRTHEGGRVQEGHGTPQPAAASVLGAHAAAQGAEAHQRRQPGEVVEDPTGARATKLGAKSAVCNEESTRAAAGNETPAAGTEPGGGGQGDTKPRSRARAMLVVGNGHVEAGREAASAVGTPQMESVAGGEPPCRAARQGARWAEENKTPMGAAAADETPAAGLGAESVEGSQPVGDAADGGASRRAAELGAGGGPVSGRHRAAGSESGWRGTKLRIKDHGPHHQGPHDLLLSRLLR